MLRRHLFWIFFALILALVPIHTTSAQDFFGDGWTAQYYDNPNLAGNPVLTEPLVRLDLQFGDGSPDESVPSDNFSAIFTTNEVFQAGTNYEFVAEVDEGVRVVVAGRTIIDQFNTGAGTYSATFRTSGSQEIRVEFREGGGNASIRFYWRIVAGNVAPSLPPGALPATVIRTNSLIMRDAPFLGSGRITSIGRGETYAVIGRDADARWFFLDTGNVQGWAFGYYLFIDGNEFNAPVVSSFNLGGIETSDVVVRAISGLKLRQQPNVNSAQIGRVTWGDIMAVTGRSEFGSWYRVIYKDTEGWVFSPFTEVVQGNAADIQVLRGTGRGVQAADPEYDISVDN